MIIKLDRLENSRAVSLKLVMDKVKAALRFYPQGRLPVQQIGLIILELAKNTLDHSSGAGSIEIDDAQETSQFAFRYCDTGQPFVWKSFLASKTST